MSKDRIQESGGNVFADLGFADPVTHKLKAELVRRIDSILKTRGLNQSAAAPIVGIGQPDLSRLLNGKFRDMSVERLLRILTRLDCDIDINVHFAGQTVGESIHLGRSRIAGFDHRPHFDLPELDHRLVGNLKYAETT